MLINFINQCYDRFFFLDDLTGFEITYLLEVRKSLFFFLSATYFCELPGD